MDASPAKEIGDDGDGSHRRACDQCRVRKIRCDKNTPCSNCVTARRSCSSTGIGQRPKEPRQRVLISTQYERKIDLIEERLGRIEQLLRNLPSLIQQGQGAAAAGVPSSASPAFVEPRPTPPLSSRDLTPSLAGDGRGSADRATSGAAGDGGECQGPCDDDDEGDADAESPFEGDSSMTAHTAFASEFLHHAVGRTSLNSSLDPSMHSALTSLQQIVHMQRRTSTMAEARFPNQKPLPKGGLRDLPMPPLRAVVGVLRALKGLTGMEIEYAPVSFTLMCSFVGIDDYTEHCRRVYFATEDFSQASFIIAVSGLYYLFQERAQHEQSRDPAVAAEYQRYAETCRDNLETALAHFSLIQAPKRENVEALLLGSSYAVEIAKPSLAWQLNAAASQLCLTMGYHRAAPPAAVSMQQPSTPSLQQQQQQQQQRRPCDGASPALAADEYGSTRKQVLFWFTYTLDKGLALRMGRASVIQDHDITVPWQLGRMADWDEYRDTLNVWIRHARVQGRMYDELYSPAALLRPIDARARTAAELVAELRELLSLIPSLRYEDQFAKVGRIYDQNLIEMLTKSDEVSFLSSLALCYRAIPPEVPIDIGGGVLVGGPGRSISSTFSQACIETAREAMRAHQSCMHIMQENNDMAAAYVHWTILYAPFIPFIVTFCHVIETSDPDDLHRLLTFTAGLEGLRALSDPINKLHRLCNALANVANMYVETKKAMQTQAAARLGGNASATAGGPVPQDQAMYPVGMEFDMYLRDLGFMPGPNGAAPGAPGGDVVAGGGAAVGHVATGAAAAAAAAAAPAGMDMFHSAQLGDWFSGNLSMMGMLERDMSGFSPSNWPPSTNPGGGGT